MDALFYFRRGASTGDLTVTEAPNTANSLAVRTYANGVGPSGMYVVVKVPAAGGADGAKNLVCTVQDAADNGSGAPGAFANISEGTTITFTGITTSQRTKYAKISGPTREWLGINFVPTAGGNFKAVAAYLTNMVPLYQ